MRLDYEEIIGKAFNDYTDGSCLSLSHVMGLYSVNYLSLDSYFDVFLV